MTFTLNNIIIEEIVYIAQDVSNFYISLDLCKRLLLINEDFPNHQRCETNNLSEIQLQSSHNLPPRPDAPSFLPTEENTSKLEIWLLDAFSKTTFNTDIEPLPLMTGKKHHIHITENAEPYITHSPIPIPHHWKEEVKRQLDQDVDMGVVRKVSVGEADEWCSQMVVVGKKDGKPRRTVDFQNLNRFCKRETHHTPSPYVVSNIPTKSYKTILDAYNGYHQVPLDEESIPLTTFIIQFGRYQYLRAPQGHISSNDAYTHRYDDIIKDVPRKVKVVDDVLLYDCNIEEAFTLHSVERMELQ